LYVALKRSKVLVELALRPESRPKARKPPKVRYARTRRGTKANGFRLRGQQLCRGPVAQLEHAPLPVEDGPDYEPFPEVVRGGT
jgi:hypothetical protein